MKLYYYLSKSVNPYYNIATECSFVDYPRDGVVLYLWSNDNTIVIGKHQNAIAECDYKQLIADGGHLARRYSGGGAVYHDVNNLNFTFVADNRYYDKSIHFDVIIDALADYGLKATLSGRNDMEISGRKFSGNAFYSHNGINVHHGTLLLNTNTEKMTRYLTVNKAKLVAHGVDSVKARVINLCEIAKVDKEQLCNSILASAEYKYNTTAVRLEENDFNNIYIDNKIAQLSSNDWLYGFESYSNTIDNRFSWGEVQISYNVNKGIITDLAIYTDALDVATVDATKQQLLGSVIADLQPKNIPIYDDIVTLLV